jgi:hypothetical protein
VAWIHAAYFAVAWLLLLGVIIRPDHASRPVLILVTAIALATLEFVWRSGWRPPGGTSGAR